MATKTVTIGNKKSEKNLPDASLTLDGSHYTLTVTGITDTVDFPREISDEERIYGIIGLDPIKITTTEKRDLELILLRAVEIITPPELLENEVPENGKKVLDKQQLLLANLTRLVRRLLLKLEA